MVVHLVVAVGIASSGACEYRRRVLLGMSICECLSVLYSVG
jgi:hypothetical protein